MSDQVILRRTVEVSVFPVDLAEAFWEMDDDAQAQFFVEVDRLAAVLGSMEAMRQAHAIGRHLRDCRCSTPGARSFVREIVNGMDLFK